MRDEDKSERRLKGELAGLRRELADLRRRNEELEALEVRRRRAEEALRAGEERYRTLVEESFDGVLVHDGNLINFVNRRFRRMFGYGSGELEGRAVWSLIHPDSRDLARTRAQGRLDGEAAPPRYEIKCLRKDGTIFDGEINARPITLDGEPAVQVWVKDVTERKATEEALRESEERYRTLTESALAGIFIYQDDQFVYLNPRFARIHGYDHPDELIGLELADLIHPEDRDLVEGRARQRELGERTTDRYRFRARKKDGSTVWLETEVTRIIYQGRGAGMGHVIDVTEQHLAQEALREREEWYRATFEHTGTIMMILEPDTTISMVNSRFTELTGYTKEEVEGRMSWTDLIIPDDVEWMLPQFRKRIESGHPGPTEVEFSYSTKAEGIRRAYGVVGSVPGTNYVISSVIDVTDRKKDEEELHKYRHQLEELVAERTAELRMANEKLSHEIAERQRFEEELRASEARYRSLFEDSPISLWDLDISKLAGYLAELRQSGVTDLEDYFKSNPESVTQCARLVRVVDVNSATLELFGASRKKDLMEPGRVLYTPQTWRAFEGAMLALAQGRTSYETEAVSRTFRGDIKHVFMRLTAVSDRHGRLGSMLVSFTDITERKQAENDHLQGEKLQAAIETAGAACHELNQPLQAIFGLAEIALRDSSIDDPQRSVFETILSQAERMGEVTGRLNRLTDYRTKPYLDQTRILDIEESSE